MRTRSTNMRGWIGLIEGGSGTVIGLADLTDVLLPLNTDQMRKNVRKHGFALMSVQGWGFMCSDRSFLCSYSSSQSYLELELGLLWTATK